MNNRELGAHGSKVTSATCWLRFSVIQVSFVKELEAGHLGLLRFLKMFSAASLNSFISSGSEEKHRNIFKNLYKSAVAPGLTISEESGSEAPTATMLAT